ncbi:MAG: flagellar hook-associated protein FlgK [Lachnospiraceae bacterium]|nr:flagellar hook-associated protein FlgK [Lachnospiraceae bacterium]
MGNLMTSMWTAVAGMGVSQSFLNTTAHNLTNANTEGYTRQQSMIVDSYYNTVAGRNKDFIIGTGTAVETIRQIRNEFYDASYREEVGREGFYRAQYECISEVEDLFGEVNGVEFQEDIQQLWESIQELAKEPDSIVVRSGLVNSASDFLTRAKDIYRQLDAYQKDLNDSVITTVNKINELGQTIYDLNKKIVAIEAPGVENANDLRDTRNKCLDELAELIDITYREDMDGSVYVLAEGTNFVTSMGCNKMGLEKIEHGSDLVIPTWPSYKENVYDEQDFAHVTTGSDTGYLKGLLMARGTGVVNQYDVPREPLREDYDSPAAYEDAMNRYLTGTKQYNETIDTSSVMTVMAQIDTLVSGVAEKLDSILAPNKTMEILVDNGRGGYITKEITVLDEEKATVGMDRDRTMGETIFARMGTERYKDVEVTVYKLDHNGDYISDGQGGYVTEKKMVRQYNEVDVTNNNTLYTINNLKINHNIVEDYSKIPLSTKENNGEFDYSNVVVDLASMWDETFAKIAPGTMTNYTFQDYYTAMINDIGNVGLTMHMMMEGQETMVGSIADMRENYMGVSQDEELSFLMKAQNAYNASSRYFNVINEMIETLVQSLG